MWIVGLPSYKALLAGKSGFLLVDDSNDMICLGVLHSDQYMIRRKRTEEEEKLLKLLQGMKPQDGFTTWCEQMLHALNTSANNSSSSVDGRRFNFITFSNIKGV